MPDFPALIAAVRRGWIVPIPRDSDDPSAAETLRGYRLYVVAAICCLVLVARAVPTGDSGWNWPAAILSSVAVGTIIGVLDWAFGAKRMFIQFSWLVTALIQIALFVLIDLVAAGSGLYVDFARETDWHMPGILLAGLLTLVLILFRSGLRGGLSLRAAFEALLLVLGSTILFAVALGLDEHSFTALADHFLPMTEGTD